jgi:hypothetical protein
VTLQQEHSTMTPAPVSTPPTSEPAAARSSWLDTAPLLLLTTGWAYLTGWAYAWRFFSHVQLGLLALDIPKEYFFVYGLWVCQRWALLLVPVLLCLVGLIWYRRRHPASVWSSKPAALVVAFGLFVLAYGLGVESGSGHYGLQQQQDFPAMPRVRVWLKAPASSDANLTRLATELPQGCHRMLLLNRSMLFVFRAPPGGPPARLAVLALPLAEVQALLVLPVFTSCPASVSQ